MTPQAAVLTFSGRTYADETAAMADLLRLFEAVAATARQEATATIATIRQNDSDESPHVAIWRQIESITP